MEIKNTKAIGIKFNKPDIVMRLTNNNQIEKYKKHNAIIEEMDGLFVHYAVVVKDYTFENKKDIIPEDAAGYCVITKELVEAMSITEPEVKNIAFTNLMNSEPKIRSMFDAITGILGNPGQPENDIKEYETCIVDARDFGAAAILSPVVHNRLKAIYGKDKLVFLPSSIHEVIITPFTSKDDIKAYNEMVKQVNESEVSESDRLADCAFIIDLDTHEIKVA